MPSPIIAQVLPCERAAHERYPSISVWHAVGAPKSVAASSASQVLDVVQPWLRERLQIVSMFALGVAALLPVSPVTPPSPVLGGSLALPPQPSAHDTANTPSTPSLFFVVFIVSALLSAPARSRWRQTAAAVPRGFPGRLAVRAPGDRNSAATLRGAGVV
jgi:hypothetical protein